MQSKILFLWAISTLLLLTACGGSDDSGAVSSGSNEVTDQQPQIAKVNCPAVLTTAARASDQPVDDVVGVRLGLSYDEVSNVALCRNSEFKIDSSSEWGRSFAKYSSLDMRRILRATNGEECTWQEVARSNRGTGFGSTSREHRCSTDQFKKGIKDATETLIVLFNGVYGKEKANGIWHSRVFLKDEEPSVDALIKSLTDKYGSPQKIVKKKSSTKIVWVHDTRGRLMSESNQLFNRCLDIDPVFSNAQRLTSACGLTISVLIDHVRDSEILAGHMYIALMDQKNFIDETEQFKIDIEAEKNKIDESKLLNANNSAAQDI